MPRTIRRLHRSTVPLTVNGVHLTLSTMSRDGSGRPLVFLHGFGSTKEDYADVVHQAALDDRPVIASDAPGCGASRCSDLSAVDVPFLVDVAETLLRRSGVDAEFDLVGHSLGGLTGLLLADRNPDRVAAFVDIEGNLAPEDCFLSRQVLDHAAGDPEEFLQDFVERVWESKYAASALYAAGVAHKVQSRAVAPIFTSMVHLSEHGDLMAKFLGLPARTMLMYGEQNRTLSYLPLLRDTHVDLVEIPQCGHFPMYSNPTAMWHHIATFLTATR
jgi:pimeloyl-ACP methyl ester carboxylesterase